MKTRDDLYLAILVLRLAKRIRNIKSFLLKEDRYFQSAYRQEFFRKAFRALAFNGIAGDYAEFGCHTGNTFGMAYKASRKFKFICKMWALDSFAGLPSASREDDHPAWITGTMVTSAHKFKNICRVHGIPESQYETVVGYYSDTLSATNPRLPRNMSMVYIDCDLYSSTKTVLNFLSDKLKHGMIIAFDDYYCWSSSTVSGERKAFQEFVQLNYERFAFAPYLSFDWYGMSFVVEKRTCSATGDAP
jgi:O-methyltransferase